MHSHYTTDLVRQRQAQLLAEADQARLARPARRGHRPLRGPRLRVLAALAGLAVAIGLTVLPRTAQAAEGEGWYGRPNTMTCIYTTVSIDAPTNVPLTGPVTWVADVHVKNPTTGAWESRYTASFTNRADRVGITAGPWADQDGNATYVTSAAMPTDVIGPVEVAVYNHFYSHDTGQWVQGFWADSTLTGGKACTLSGGPINV